MSDETLLDDDLEAETAALSEMSQEMATLQTQAKERTDRFQEEIQAIQATYEEEMVSLQDQQTELQQRILKQTGRVEILQDQRRKLLGETDA